VWDFPDEVATSGAGPVRALDGSETMVTGLPLGRILPTGDGAMESPMVFEGRLLYMAAPRNDVPAPEMANQSWAIDDQYFGAWEVMLTPPSENYGYQSGRALEVARPIGESDATIFEPWLVRGADESVWLLFATETGAHAARGASVEGPFENPIELASESAAGRPLRRPCAISRDDGGFDVYLTDGVDIYHALGDRDFGLSALTPIPLLSDAVDDLGRTETAVMNAAPVRAITPTGRSMVRIYFEVHRSDATVHLGMAASLDGINFERTTSRVFDDELNPRFPAPFLEVPHTTRLVLSRSYFVDNIQHRALIGAVTPASTPADDEEDGSR